MLEIDFVLFSPLLFSLRFSHDGSHEKLTICFDIFSLSPSHTFWFFRCDTINSSSGFRFDKKFIYRLHRSHMGHGRLEGGDEVERVKWNLRNSAMVWNWIKIFFSSFFSCTQFTIVRSQIFPQLFLLAPVSFSLECMAKTKFIRLDKLLSHIRQLKISLQEKILNTFHPLIRKKLAQFFVISNPSYRPSPPSAQSREFSLCVSAPLLPNGANVKIVKIVKKIRTWNLRLSCVSPLLPLLSPSSLSLFCLLHDLLTTRNNSHTSQTSSQKSLYFSSSSYKNTPSPQSSNRWASKGNWIGSWGWELSEFSLLFFSDFFFSFVFLLHEG